MGDFRYSNITGFEVVILKTEIPKHTIFHSASNTIRILYLPNLIGQT
jgi:hypothetical protein